VTTSNEPPRRPAALKQALLVIAGILALTVVAAFVAIVAFVPIWFLVVLIGIKEMALLFLLAIVAFVVYTLRRHSRR
jgi:hypothetical protein